MTSKPISSWPHPPPKPNPDGSAEWDEALLERYKSELLAHLEAIKGDIASKAATTAVAADVESASQAQVWTVANNERAAQIASEASLLESTLQRQAANRQLHHSVTQLMYAAYIDVAKGSLDRAQKRAEAVTAAATAIGGLYGAILALVYGVGQFAETMPSRGAIPTLFLGAAVVLAVSYLAYLTKPEDGEVVTNDDEWQQDLENQRNAYVTWVGRAVLRRRKLLQASVISLGFGVATLPAAFIGIDEVLAWAFSGLAAAMVFTVVLNKMDESSPIRS